MARWNRTGIICNEKGYLFFTDNLFGINDVRD